MTGETKRERQVLLLVEDEEALREELAEELADMGYEVHAAKDACEAEELLAKYRPGVVVCDVILPDKSGFELLESLLARKALPDTTAFLFLTALSDREPELRGLRLGADDYLCKPVDLDLLQIKIEKVTALAARSTAQPTDVAGLTNIHLSPRERQVLGYIGNGHQTAAIAFSLGISEHTVNQYIKELYRKLGVHNRVEAARKALQIGAAAFNRENSDPSRDENV